MSGDGVTHEVTHRLSEDGLELTSTLRHVNGATATVCLSWDTVEDAEKHYGAAMTSNESTLIENWLPRIEQPASFRGFLKLHTLRDTRRGQLLLAVNGGPPLWKLPHAGAKRAADGTYQLRIGWLYRAYVLVWDPTK